MELALGRNLHCGQIAQQNFDRNHLPRATFNENKIAAEAQSDIFSEDKISPKVSMTAP